MFFLSREVKNKSNQCFPTLLLLHYQILLIRMLIDNLLSFHKIQLTGGKKQPPVTFGELTFFRQKGICHTALVLLHYT